MRADRLTLRPLARESAVEARANLDGVYLHASGPREVVERLLEALEGATGSKLPTAEHRAPAVPRPLAGQTTIDDFISD